jgi:5-methylcytosine-specific restriction endonuclease McrA
MTACTVCGGTVDPSPTGKQRLYCSPECKRRAEYLRNRDGYLRRARANEEAAKQGDPEAFRATKREASRRQYAVDPEHKRAVANAWTERNREQTNATARRSYWKNPESSRQRALARIAADPEAHRRTQQERYWRNPSHALVIARASRMRHREARRAYVRAHREEQRAYVQTRRARRRGNGGSYTAAQWLALCARYGERCLRCGEMLPLTPDHVVPLVQGGGSDISNIQPLCLSCNQRKGRRTTDYRRRGLALA